MKKENRKVNVKISENRNSMTLIIKKWIIGKIKDEYFTQEGKPNN